jgi:hypothetical protein
MATAQFNPGGPSQRNLHLPCILLLVTDMYPCLPEVVYCSVSVSCHYGHDLVILCAEGVDSVLIGPTLPSDPAGLIIWDNWR